MHIEIWSLGKANERFLDAGISHYLVKVNHYNAVKLDILTLPKKLSFPEAEKAKLAEEQLILQRLQPADYLILLDERGKMLRSEQWAAEMQTLMNNATKKVVILIGGAFGVSKAVQQRANQSWSLSTLVFPHQLVRLLAAEQLYRAFSILGHSPYHHA